MKSSRTFKTFLAVPHLYRAFAGLVGGNARSIYQRDHLRAKRGERILDIGCGPGDVLEVLPEGCEYVGFDANPDYIEAARRRFGSRGRFEVRYVTPQVVKEFEDFDLVMANGVLHHLDDNSAHQLFEIAKTALRKGGRLVTLDGCYVPGQSAIARYLLEHDRGQYIRNASEYQALAREHFGKITSHLRDDLMRIPYTHLVLECEL